MLRRRLFAYSVMFTAGIASGYLFFECCKILPAALLIIGLGIGITRIDLECRPERQDAERKILFACILIGFILFTNSYIRMNRCLHDLSGRPLTLEQVQSIDAIITDISRQDDSYRLIVKPVSIRNAGKIQVSYYGELSADNNSAFNTEDIRSKNTSPDLSAFLGKTITLYGELREPPGLENPGCFNYRSYLYSRGIRYTYSCKYLQLATESTYWNYRRYIACLRNKFLNEFGDGEVRGFIQGVVFGDKSEINEDILEEFNSNSTGHILAVSGLHVGFLFALLRFLTGKRKTIPVTIAIIITIILYGEMTCWSPSTARAVMVLGISLISVWLRRRADLLTSISLAAIVILTINPYNIVNSGFQLSFMALLGIAFLARPLTHYFGEALAVMLAIQLSVAPLIAYSFGSFNIASMLVNIPIVFLASILVPTSILSLLFMILCGFVPEQAVQLIGNLAHFIVELNSRLSFDKFFVTDIDWISIGGLAAYYLMLFFLSSEWTRIRILRQEFTSIRTVTAYLLIPVLCISIATHNPFLNDEIIFVNVGQGDCTHIRCEDIDILIDGGGSRYYNVGKNTLRPYLLHNGADVVNLALITHDHMDHYKGLQELSEIFPVGDAAQMRMGERVDLAENVAIEAIWPLERDLRDGSSGSENELNTVYIVYYNGCKILITGDLLAEDEMRLIEHYRGTDKLKCDILKVGHHGSKSSSSDEFLEAVDPDIAVISVGKNNTYGHPNQEVLDRLQNHGIKVYRTDENGAVGVDIRGTVLIGNLCTRGQSLKVDTLR